MSNLHEPIFVNILGHTADAIIFLPYDVGRALRLPAVRSRLVERILPEAEL